VTTGLAVKVCGKAGGVVGILLRGVIIGIKSIDIYCHNADIACRR
jgi:hypothetical protein